MFFLILTSNRTLSLENKVDLVSSPTLVRSKHNLVGSTITEFSISELIRITQKFQIRTSTSNSILELDFILYNQSFPSIVKWLTEFSTNSMMSCFLFNNQTFVT